MARTGTLSVVKSFEPEDWMEFEEEVRAIEQSPLNPRFVVVVEGRKGSTRSYFYDTVQKAVSTFFILGERANQIALCDCVKRQTVRSDYRELKQLRRDKEARITFKQWLLSF